MTDEAARPWWQLPGESALAYARFLGWLRDGPDRSIRASAARTGRSEQLYYSLSGRFRWIERAQAWDAAPGQERWPLPEPTSQQPTQGSPERRADWPTPRPAPTRPKDWMTAPRGRVLRDAGRLAMPVVQAGLGIRLAGDLADAQRMRREAYALVEAVAELTRAIDEVTS